MGSETVCFQEFAKYCARDENAAQYFFYMCALRCT